MPDQPPRKLPALGFAGFEDSSAAGGRRRRATWSLRPMHEPSAGEAPDAARRLVKEAELLQGLGRRKDE
jgi:hypothetical protein